MAKYLVCQWIAFGVLLLLNIHQINGTTVVNAVKKSPLNIAVIGAGPAGLVSAKHATSHRYDVTVYEQADELGGVWVYTNQTGKNKYGVRIHSAMYKGLRFVSIDISENFFIVFF